MSETWQNRITKYGQANPADLIANPSNARVHPDFQRQALTEALSTLGWVAPVTVNVTTGNMVDGHARVEQALAAGVKKVPVIYVELSEDEERLVLATLDPIGALAGYDAAAFGALLDQLDTSGTTALDGMLSDLAAQWLDATPAGSTDEPDPHTEEDDEAFWPVITCRVPPSLMERWKTAMAVQPGELDRDRISALLAAGGW